MMNIKKTVMVLGLAASLSAGLLAAPPTASAGNPASDALSQLFAKLDEILAAVESSSVDLGGVTPVWDKAMPASTRFTMVLGGAGGRDNTTGLVWEKTPTADIYSWHNGRWECVNHATGGVKGWRLPSVHELGSLLDVTQSNPALPAGHPFTNLVSSFNGYWTETTDSMNANVAWAVSIASGFIGLGGKEVASHIWCVRGATDGAHY